MKPTSMILIAVVVAAVVIVLALKPARGGTPAEPGTGGGSAPATATTRAALPRLLDLGAGTCIPCKLMAPILAELKSSYAGVMEVDFIDVWEDKVSAQAHGISTIPTQIFFAPDGKELFRHGGFLSKEDILAQWKTLGYDLKPALPPPAPQVPAAESVPAAAPAPTEATPPKRACCGSTP